VTTPAVTTPAVTTPRTKVAPEGESARQERPNKVFEAVDRVPFTIAVVEKKFEITGRVPSGSRVELDGEAVEVDAAGRVHVDVEPDDWPVEIELRVIVREGVEHRYRLDVPDRHRN
jgi:hypothetical protein